MERSVIECDLCHREIQHEDGVIEFKYKKAWSAYPGDHGWDRHTAHICVACQDRLLKVSMTYPVIEIQCPCCGSNKELIPAGTGWTWACPHCSYECTTASNKTEGGTIGEHSANRR